MTGGFAEISPTSASVLAEQAVLRADIRADLVNELLTVAERELADAPEDRRIAAGQRVRDLITLKAQLAL